MAVTPFGTDFLIPPMLSPRVK